MLLALLNAFCILFRNDLVDLGGSVPISVPGAGELGLSW